MACCLPWSGQPFAGWSLFLWRWARHFLHQIFIILCHSTAWIIQFLWPAWWALLASAKTPPDIVKRMNEELNKVLSNPDVSKRLVAQGIEISGGSVEKAKTFIDGQIDTWAKVVRENGIKAD